MCIYGDKTQGRNNILPIISTSIQLSGFIQVGLSPVNLRWNLTVRRFVSMCSD